MKIKYSPTTGTIKKDKKLIYDMLDNSTIIEFDTVDNTIKVGGETFFLGGEGGNLDIQINGYSIVNGGIANIITNGIYDEVNNKIATMEDINNGGSIDVQINGYSITNNGVANIITNGVYDSINNKIATMEDIPIDVLQPSDVYNGFVKGTDKLSKTLNLPPIINGNFYINRIHIGAELVNIRFVNIVPASFIFFEETDPELKQFIHWVQNSNEGVIAVINEDYEVIMIWENGVFQSSADINGIHWDFENKTLVFSTPFTLDDIDDIDAISTTRYNYTTNGTIIDVELLHKELELLESRISTKFNTYYTKQQIDIILLNYANKTTDFNTPITETNKGATMNDISASINNWEDITNTIIIPSGEYQGYILKNRTAKLIMFNIQIALSAPLPDGSALFSLNGVYHFKSNLYQQTINMVYNSNVYNFSITSTPYNQYHIQGWLSSNEIDISQPFTSQINGVIAYSEDLPGIFLTNGSFIPLPAYNNYNDQNLVSDLSGTPKPTFNLFGNIINKEDLLGVKFYQDGTCNHINSQFLYNCINFNMELILPTSCVSIEADFMYGCSSYNQNLTLPPHLNKVERWFMVNVNSNNEKRNIINIGSLDINIFEAEPYTLTSPVERKGVWTIEGFNKAAFLTKFPNQTSPQFRDLN